MIFIYLQLLFLLFFFIVSYTNVHAQRRRWPFKPRSSVSVPYFFFDHIHHSRSHFKTCQNEFGWVLMRMLNDDGFPLMEATNACYLVVISRLTMLVRGKVQLIYL